MKNTSSVNSLFSNYKAIKMCLFVYCLHNTNGGGLILPSHDVEMLGINVLDTLDNVDLVLVGYHVTLLRVKNIEILPAAW